MRPTHSPSSGSSAAYYVCYDLAPLCAVSELSVEYVQVKPILAAITLILKATGNYGDGDFRSDKGYLYVTIVYNVSICVALYCLAMFWVVINDDIKPFRPMPKFLCIKGTQSLVLQ
jgi:Organic solute transporter Ostalpha